MMQAISNNEANFKILILHMQMFLQLAVYLASHCLQVEKKMHSGLEISGNKNSVFQVLSLFSLFFR